MSTGTISQTPAEIPAERIRPGHTMQTVNAFNSDGSFLRQVRYYGTHAQAQAYAALQGIHDTNHHHAKLVTILRGDSTEQPGEVGRPTPINVELLDLTLAHIEAHPQDWDQDNWRMCFAAWASQLDGGRWATPTPNPDGWGAEYLIAEPGDDRAHIRYIEIGLGACVGVDHRARRILGLTEDQADDLFHGGNTLADLRRIVANLKAQTAAR